MKTILRWIASFIQSEHPVAKTITVILGIRG